jgi:hypothetical protein
MNKSLEYRIRKEVQEIDGGYAGYLITEDVQNNKVMQVVSCVRTTKIVGDHRAARRLLDNSEFAKFATKQ